MTPRQPRTKRLITAARWPVGIVLTSWSYLWRTTPVHRWELSGSSEFDSPPQLPSGTDRSGIQHPHSGVGPLVHRLYRTRIRGSGFSPTQLIACLSADLDAMAPAEFARFQRLSGRRGQLAVGDEYVVRMPGPWDGPVRVVALSATSFRLATLDGHLEAGQIEFRASRVAGQLEFVIESWARSGDWLSNLLYTHLRMAKETQLHMWTSVLERIVEISRGVMEGGIVVTTRRLDSDGQTVADNTGGGARRAQRSLDSLARRNINFDLAKTQPHTAENGWRVDDLVAPLPFEPSGPPVEGGSFNVAKRLMVDYQVADPARVRASYAPDAPLAGRDMLLEIRFSVLRFHVGVRVGEVYDEVREVDGSLAHVFGWGYATLEGHFEQGQMHYEVWKWRDSGTVEFHLRAFSRPATSGPWIPRAGFRLFGRGQQLAFYRAACRRMRRLTESQVETERTSAAASALEEHHGHFGAETRGTQR